MRNRYSIDMMSVFVDLEHKQESMRGFPRNYGTLWGMVDGRGAISVVGTYVHLSPGVVRELLQSMLALCF
jgi:hypothetical protein